MRSLARCWLSVVVVLAAATASPALAGVPRIILLEHFGDCI